MSSLHPRTEARYRASWDKTRCRGVGDRFTPIIGYGVRTLWAILRHSASGSLTVLNAQCRGGGRHGHAGAIQGLAVAAAAFGQARIACDNYCAMVSVVVLVLALASTRDVTTHMLGLGVHSQVVAHTS